MIEIVVVLLNAGNEKDDDDSNFNNVLCKNTMKTVLYSFRFCRIQSFKRNPNSNSTHTHTHRERVIKYILYTYTAIKFQAG